METCPTKNQTRLFFSKRTPEHLDSREQFVDYVLPPLPFQQASRQRLKKAPPSERPKRPREPKNLNGFNFVKRTLLKSKAQGGWMKRSPNHRISGMVKAPG
jgi:hypothetical protein